jgi:ABC-type transport system involved in cytochrome bd biosynthesis fused ATPase/permease subunit
VQQQQEQFHQAPQEDQIEVADHDTSLHNQHQAKEHLVSVEVRPLIVQDKINHRIMTKHSTDHPKNKDKRKHHLNPPPTTT